MDFLSNLKKSISKVVTGDNRPVVIFSSIWPIMKEANRKDKEFITELLNTIITELGRRTVLMPTFVRGFQNGVCNLDDEKSTTGVLTEAFRQLPNARRTKCAFFPFSYINDETKELEKLETTHAWGEQSVYEWMEKKNVDFLMLGADATHCSYLHRLEYLAKDYIDYRYDKEFSGKIIHEERELLHTETLYVRSLDPLINNNFRVLEPILKKSGMKEADLNGIRISGYTASVLNNNILPVIKENPYFTVTKK